jgi:hypothetical protein
LVEERGKRPRSKRKRKGSGQHRDIGPPFVRGTKGRVPSPPVYRTRRVVMRGPARTMVKTVAPKKAALKPRTVSMAKYIGLKKQTLALTKYLGDIRRVAGKASKPKAKKRSTPKARLSAKRK